jgi:hypothetical protein
MEKLCKNCELKPGLKYSKYSSGDFCCVECVKSYSTKNKRNEINMKVSRTLTGRTRAIPIKKICPKCLKEFFVKKKKKNQVSCSVECSRSLDSYREKVSKLKKEICSNIDERIRLREIGRKGGFGKKGVTDRGVYYQSTFEKNVFEYLDTIGVKYIPHLSIPNSSKISDVYLNDLDLWIELDGIDREKKKKWIGKDYDYWIEKLETYKNENLNFIVIKSFEEFKEKIVP